jgi:hypothetical protein
MKFQRIGTGSALARMAIFPLLLLALAGASARAADEDLPPPAENDIPAPRTSVGPKKSPTESPLSEDESIPAPSLGDESLPEPSVDRGQERAKNQVNKAPEDDEIFLPTPNVNDNVYYAPVGTPAPRVTREDLDWRYVGTNRPAFSLLAGLGFKSYANDNVKQTLTTGYMLGVDVRALSLAETLFLHAIYRWSSYTVGDVGDVMGVVDNTQHFGGMLELGVGRRLSLSLSLLRRQTLIKALTRYSSAAANIAADPAWYLGIGGQWDFYVIPHGSAGVRIEAERDLYTMTLVLSMEPQPPKRLSLNYGSVEQ